jgi:uroporphyrinogen decarboxylase
MTASRDPLLLRALRHEKVERVPVWLMRQAGRYMAEYREIRAGVSFLELCHSPELAAKVTLDAARILDVDAAILFSDILVPAEAMGADVIFDERGPTIGNPIREPKDVARIRVPDPAVDLPFVAETLRRIRAELPAEKALLGFAGAPFTLASYLIEGGSSRDFVLTKSFFGAHGAAFAELLDRIAEGTIACLLAQARAGAQAVQLFDSWAGCLAPDDYREFALPPTRKILAAMRDAGVPALLYGNGCSALLEEMSSAGPVGVSLDWRIDVADGWRRIGFDKACQGNLDPLSLLAPESFFLPKVDRILDAVGDLPGFVFNLGHGIDRRTPVAHVKALIARVKERGAAR